MVKRTMAFLAALALAGTAHAQTTLRVVMHSDLKILDPIWTTAYIVRNHGYMIYDVLFAPNAKLEYKPQMVDTHSKSADGLTWKFKLRDGLKFSDGSPVEGKDVVASLKRWGDRNPVGKTLMAFTKDVVATGPATFELHLTKPFGLVIEMLGTPENPLFIHREKEAKTPSDTQISEPIGSGPFVMVKEEWVPGSKVVYKKNDWGSGFTTSIDITNQGDALNGWTLKYSYAGTQKLASGWSGKWSQSGQDVTVQNESWNGALASGATVNIGAQFTYSGTNTDPTSFTLNGTPCNGSTSALKVALTSPAAGAWAGSSSRRRSRPSTAWWSASSGATVSVAACSPTTPSRCASPTSPTAGC